MTPCDICSVFAAVALSPAMIAFFTFLTAVRSVDFIVALRLRVTSVCLARLRACAELAMELRALSCLSYAQLRLVYRCSFGKTAHNTRFCVQQQRRRRSG